MIELAVAIACCLFSAVNASIYFEKKARMKVRAFLT